MKTILLALLSVVTLTAQTTTPPVMVAGLAAARHWNVPISPRSIGLVPTTYMHTDQRGTLPCKPSSALRTCFQAVLVDFDTNEGIKGIRLSLGTPEDGARVKLTDIAGSAQWETNRGAWVSLRVTALSADYNQKIKDLDLAGYNIQTGAQCCVAFNQYELTKVK